MTDVKTIAVVGNPNCGKTTLFNALTGGKQQVGNWPGVTVEKKYGMIKVDNKKIDIIDLPGIYSLSAYSEDEKVARDYILSGEPDFIINIIDATNLERNLFLTSQLIEMKVPVIVFINMMDLSKKKKIKIDIDNISDKLDFPVVGGSALDKESVEKLKNIILSIKKEDAVSNTHIEYPNEIEDVILKWKEKLAGISQNIGSRERWIALKIIEQDPWIVQKIIQSKIFTREEIDKTANHIEKLLKDTPDIIIADYRYGFIHGVTKSSVKKSISKQDTTDKIDKVVLNRFLGIPIFLLAMFIVFWVTISIGGAFIDFFDGFFGTIFVDGFGNLLRMIGIPDWLVVIFANGVGGGIQTVSTFVPIIFFMFFMLSILEDSGYMARAAFVMDRFMKLLGLPGKSFVPLIVGFGCTVPAVMATRTLDNKKDRLLTIFMSPFMSCGARLPVYVLIATALFNKYAGLVVFAIYMIGIVLAVVTGFILKNTIYQGESSRFIMELPPYHMPRFKHIMIHTWIKLKDFILRAGKVIIIIVVVLSFVNSIGTDGTFGNDDSQKSLLSFVGKKITPVFTPMGIQKNNWPATVGIFTGIFAKEAVVGTLDSLYSQVNNLSSDTTADVSETPVSKFNFWGQIADAFKTIPKNLAAIFVEETNNNEDNENAIFQSIGKYFTRSQAIAFLLFILIYFPCLATFSVIIKEAGSFMAIVQITYLTLLAWIVATLYYQIVSAHNIIYILLALGLFVIIIATFYLIGKSEKVKQLKREDKS